MKRYISYMFVWFMAMSGISSVSAQTGKLGNGANVENIEIRRIRDSVRITFLFNLEDMNVPSNRSIVLEPLFKEGKKAEWLPAVEVMGRKRHLYYERNGMLTYAESPAFVVEKKKGETMKFPYRASLPYSEWMDNAELYMSSDECGCGQVVESTQEPLARADIAFTPLLVYITPQVEMVKTRCLSGEAYLDFPVNKTVIYPEYRRNPEELAKINATIDTVKNDPDIRVTGMWVKGFASPEGSYPLNTRLAKGRTEALKNYIIDRDGLADTLFQTAYEPENWEGLRKYVAESDLSDKEGILALIDSDEEPDRKEREIRTRYPKSYRILLRECYPGLRRSDYRIDYTVRGFNVDEAKEVFRTRPQNLSLREMFAVAQTYEPGSEEFVDVFRKAVVLYPEDEVANLNAANALLEQGIAQPALAYLEKAGDSPQADNARGVAMYLLKRYDEAQEWFTKALSGGLEEAGKNLTVVAE